MSLKGKNAIVTGACYGIGLAVVKELLKEGVEVVGLFDLYNNLNGIRPLQKEFSEKTIEFFKTDVRSDENIRSSYESFINKHKYVDIVIANAGIFNEISYKDTILINLLGAITTIEMGLEYMSISRKGRGGVVVTTASIGSFYFHQSHPVYCSTKHGILAYTKSMANDINIQLHGVKFYIICPGATDTPLYSTLWQNIKPEFRDQMVLPEEQQTAEELATAYTKIINSGKNGAIWIVIKGQIQEHEPIQMEFND